MKQIDAVLLLCAVAIVVCVLFFRSCVIPVGEVGEAYGYENSDVRK